MRLTVHRQQVAALQRRQRGQQGGLAARTGAEVQPALVASFDRRPGEGQGDQLGSFVLDARPALGHGGYGAGVPALQHHAVRRQQGAWAGQLVGRGAAGARDQDHSWGFVVGGEQGVELVLADGPGQLLHDPAGMAVRHRGESDRVAGRVGRDAAYPPGEVVLGDPAEDGVAEAGRPLPDPGPDQVDGGADRGVRGHPHREQLVGAQPQRVQHLGLDLRQRPVHARGEDGVVRAPTTEGAGDQLGGEGGVAAGQLVLPEDRGQHQVGVGVVDPDRLQHVVRREPGRVGGGAPLRGLAAGAAGAPARVSHRRGAPGPAASAPWRPRRR